MSRLSQRGVRKEVSNLDNSKSSSIFGGLTALLRSPEKSELRIKALIAVGMAAILVIVLADSTGGAKSASAEVRTYTAADCDEYTERMERRLTEMISSIDGAGETKVMITLECGTEYVYASRQKTTSAISENSDTQGRMSRDEKRSGEDNLILIDAGKGEEPLILKELSPTVAGVVVVCSGADNPLVRQQIINVVTVALGTGANRVCVTKMG